MTNAFRYAIAGDLLPPIGLTLAIAEVVRSAALSVHGKLHARDGVPAKSSVLSGKTPDGEMLVGHGHAMYFVTDEDGDGRLDRVTIFARSGFDESESDSLRNLTGLGFPRGHPWRGPLELMPLGHGATGEYVAGPLGRSKTWESVTPYYPTRHPKSRGRDRVDFGDPKQRLGFIQADLEGQLAGSEFRNGKEMSSPPVVRVLAPGDDREAVKGGWRVSDFLHFRSRRGDGMRARPGSAFRIEFEDVQPGPLALGWACHFGMGLFWPVGQDAG